MPRKGVPFSQSRRTAVTLMKEHGEIVVMDLAKAEGIRGTSAGTVLRKMVRDGIIVRRDAVYRDKAGRNRVHHVYSLKGEGPQTELDLRPRRMKRNSLTDSAKLTEAAKILFPGKVVITEEFLAWVDWTKELMHG